MAVEKKRLSKKAKKTAKQPAKEEEPVEEPKEEEEDSESEEEVAEEEVAEAPTEAKRKTKANRLQEAQDADSDEEQLVRGVVYIGHLPRGFFEPQMQKFFGQFGTITRLRLSRSKKNAQSKGYAYIEFEDDSVAEIVAKTMNKYLLFGRTLVCELVPKEKQHPALFKGHKRRMVNMTKSRRKTQMAIFNNRPPVKVNGVALPQTTTLQAARRKQSDKKLRKMLGDLGVAYDMDAVEERAPRGLPSPRSSFRASPHHPSPKLAPAAAPVIAAAAGGKKRKADAAVDSKPAEVATGKKAKRKGKA